MKIDVAHIARLARLGLSKEEAELYEEQLSSILEFANSLQKINTDGVPPTSHAIPMNNILRDDKAAACEVTEEILANAPEKEGRMFKVPKILE